MRALVQRVSRAKVTVRSADGPDTVVGEIGPGLCVLVGVTHDDDEADAARMADKVWRLRVFDDADGVMNLAAADVGGAVAGREPVHALRRHPQGPAPVLRGRRSSRTGRAAHRPVVTELRALGATVATGRFRADMAVELVNDGPVSLLLEL